MAGLILNTKSTGFEPEKMEFDPTKQTVQGRVDDLLKQDSPYLQDARTRTAQVANTRGLINSSIAAGAGELAAIQAATPIAAQDAGFANTVASRNQDAANAALSQGAQGEQAIEQQTLRGTQSKELSQLESANKQLLQSSDSAARFYSQVSASVSDILKEPGISAEAKQQLVQKQVDLLKSGLAVVGGINNLDLTGLLKFDTFTGGAPAPVPAP